MIDLHCHILPAVDDGSGSLEESLAMARCAVDDGIHTIVATPHTLNGHYQNPEREVAARVHDLRQALGKNNIDLDLLPGADVRLCPNLLDYIRKAEAGTLAHAGKYLLLELPAQTIPQNITEEIFSLKLAGITPIITHPERNAMIQGEPGILRHLVEMGALAQVTAMSIMGDFGPSAADAAEELLVQRLIHVMASDAHSAEGRPPALARAVELAAEILEDYEEAESMVTTAPAAILAGQPLEVPEVHPRKRGTSIKL